MLRRAHMVPFGEAWPGTAVRVGSRRGVAGEAWQGGARHDEVWRGRLG